MSGTLYFVATPIGNLDDITLRAIKTLKEVDEVFCEDTRHSVTLLNAYNIKKPLSSYHKFNYREVIPQIIQKLKDGKNLALITDAGTPSVSDPGSELIEHLVREQLPYTIIPGATASVNAYALSGFTTGFSFLGFLPEKQKEKETLLKEVLNYHTALIFYIAPHDLKKTLHTLHQFLGNRKVVIIKELTKLYEQVLHTTLGAGYEKTPKGEFVIVVEGQTKEQKNELNSLSLEEHLNYYLKLNYKKNEAIKQIAKDRKVKKQEIYNALIKN
jgi:16S rRNA (cytidine1402-2'-O)-methyltransferase